MRPTRSLHRVSKSHRIFKCVLCGNETPWLDKPALNGTFGELHRTEEGVSSGLSLMSDPVFCPPLPERKRR